MTTVIEKEIQSSDTDDKNKLIHIICHCNEDISLCGAELTGRRMGPEVKATCVVCADLNEYPCPRCGCNKWEISCDQ